MWFEKEEKRTCGLFTVVNRKAALIRTHILIIQLTHRFTFVERKIITYKVRVLLIPQFLAGNQEIGKEI